MSKHIRRMVSFFLILIVSFSLAAPVFATGDNAATIQIGSLTSDVTRTAYSYKAAQKSLYLSGGKYILVGDINTEYTLKIYVYGNAQIEIRNLMAVQDNAGEFNAGTPVMEISGGRTVDLKFTGNCVFRGGALSAGILVMDKVTLHILPTTDTSTFSCGVYRYGGAGIGVADSSCNATISLDASKLTSGYIALGGGVKGVDNQDGVAVDPGKSGKLMVNNTKVNNIRRAMRWSGNTSKEVYALYVNGGTGSTWFAACGDRITVKAVLETGQIFEKWYDEPDSPIAFSTPKSTTATFGMPSYDVYIYAVSYRTDGTKLDIYNISIQGGESDALACNAGEIIAIIASTFVGKKFITWKYEGPTKVEFADPKSMSTTFVMPKGHVIIVAEFQDEGLPITVVGGDASRESAIPGTVITITAKPPENMVFFQWKITEGKGSDGKNLNLANKSNAVTTFVMIDKAVSIKAIFVESPRTVSIAGGIADKKMADKGEKITVLATLKEGEVFKEWEVVYVSAAGKNTKSQKVYKDTFTNIEKEYQSITRIRAIVEKKATYPITVENGTADHTEATAGTVVTVTAVVPENQKLVSWYIDAEGVELESPLSLNTTFVMPSSPVKVTAAFEEEKVPSGLLEMTVNSRDILNHGKVGKLSDPVRVTAGGMVLVPLFSVLESLGVHEYFEYYDLIVVEDENLKIEALVNAREIAINGKNHVMSYPFCQIGGCYYLSAPDFSRLFGYEVYTTQNRVCFYQGGYTLTVKEGIGDFEAAPQGIWVTVYAKMVDGKQFVKWISDTDVTMDNPYSPVAKVYMPGRNITLTAVYEDISDEDEVSLAPGIDIVYTDQEDRDFDNSIERQYTLSVQKSNRDAAGYDAMLEWLGGVKEGQFFAKEILFLSASTSYTLGNLMLDYAEDVLPRGVLVTLHTSSLKSYNSSISRTPAGVVCAYVEEGEMKYIFLPDLDAFCDSVSFLASHIGTYYVLFDEYGLALDIPYLNISGVLETKRGVVTVSGIFSSLGKPVLASGFAYREDGSEDWVVINHDTSEPYSNVTVTQLKPNIRYEFCMYASPGEGVFHYSTIYSLTTQSENNGILSCFNLGLMSGCILLIAGFGVMYFLQKKGM